MQRSPSTELSARTAAMPSCRNSTPRPA
jgi:hypothetical protein